VIIIRDDTMGISYSFVATHSGYYKAYAQIQAITGQGHRVSGDVGKVIAYVR
jgi:hypothetical protein